MSDSFETSGSASASWSNAADSGGGSDSVTDTSTEGWGSRIGGSIIAALIGLVLVPIALVLLFWNEGRAVDAIRALNRGASAIVEVNPVAVEQSANGKLVHVTGQLQPVTAAKDPLFGVTYDGLVRLNRKVEMYQWEQKTSATSHQNIGGSKTTETTYSYEKTWSEQPINSGGFKNPNGHQNPAMQVRSETFDGDDVRIGAYKVDPALLNKMETFTPLQPQAPPPAGYQVSGEDFYKGQNPAQPEIGDTRVGFAAVRAQTVSVAAAQTMGVLTGYRDRNGYTIALVEAGVVPADVMFHDERGTEGKLTWILRGVGFAGVLIGFALMSRPLAMLAAFLPFLESIVGAGAFLVALGLAIPISLLTISIAWIVYRPLIGGLLLVAAIGAFFGLRQLLPKRRAVPMAAPARGPAAASAPAAAPGATSAPPGPTGTGSSFFR